MMARVYYGNATDAQRDYIRRIIHNRLGACQSALVNRLLQRGDVDGFGPDEIEGLYPDPADWSIDRCREYMDGYGIALPASEAGLDDWRNAVIEGADSQEVCEWWLVKDADLADDLRHEGEPILANDYGTWWGRTCTGQNIEMDPTFWRIFQDDLL